MTEKLKPCPFCGEAAEVHAHRAAEDAMEAFVECLECLARTDYFEASYAPTREAIAAWNRRPALSQGEPHD